MTPTNCNIEIFPKYQPGASLANWTFGVQQSLGHSMSLDVSYVGNHLTNGNMEPDLNEPTVGFSTTFANSIAALPGVASPTACLAVTPVTLVDAPTGPCTGVTSAVSRRPYNTKYPYFGNIDQYGPGGKANYDGLQITVRNRTTHGLTCKAISSSAHSLSSVAGGNNLRDPDPLQPQLKLRATAEAPSRPSTLTATYDIPTFGSELTSLQKAGRSTARSNARARPGSASRLTPPTLPETAP